ncbi:MAG: GntR family transcriptional regulator [Synergistaceae bacterium]|jgi:GntR family transcriptional regulator of gluconate operon|nr:GntR family transcriptional regulator [Synergistaceae bacterium]
MAIVVDRELNHRTLTEEVSDYLRRELLLADTWAQGSFLREEDVANALKVSRAPVREAIKTLVGLGILRLIPRRGAVVVKFTPQEIEELYDVRFALESLVFDVLVHQAALTSADYDHLENILSDILKLARSGVARKEVYWTFSNMDLDFHLYFVEKAKLKVILQILRSVYAQLQHAILRDWAESKKNLVYVVEQHQKMLDMLKAGNLEELKKNRFYSYFVRRGKTPT